MNLSEVLKQNDVTVRGVIELNPKAFYTIPFDLINKTYTVEEQLAYLEKHDFRPQQCELLRNMLNATTKVNADFFIKTFMPMTYWANDRSEIITWIDNHPDCVEIMQKMIMYTDQNNVRDNSKLSNILDGYASFNLVQKHFNSDLYHTMATNDFALCGESNYETWMEDETHKKMIETSAFTFIQLHVLKDLKKEEIFTPNFYAVPETLVHMLTAEQVEILVHDVYRFFDEVNEDQKEYLDNMLSAISHRNLNVTHELFKKLATDLGVKVPKSVERNEEYAKKVAEESKIEPNYEDPFYHARVQNWNKIRGNSVVAAKIIAEACKVENVLKDEYNLSYLLRYVELNEVPEELFAELANFHLDFLVKACNHLRDWQLTNLLTNYIDAVDDYEYSLNVIFALLDEYHAVRFVSDYNRPEYIDYVLQYNYDIGLKMIADILSKNKYHQLAELIA